MERRNFFKILPIAAAVATPIVSLTADTNYCKEDLIPYMTDQKEVIEPKKSYRIKVTLNNRDNIVKMQNYLLELRLKPYNEELVSAVLSMLMIDHKSEGIFQKRAIDPLAKNKKALHILLDSFIFVQSPELKSKINTFISKNMRNNGKVSLMVLSKSYRNFLILNNIGYFKYQGEDIEFVNSIRKQSRKDLPFKSLYEMINGNFDLNPDKDKYYIRDKKTLIKRLESCYSEKEISKHARKFSLAVFLEIYFLSLKYPDLREDLRFYYYAVSERTNLWELMDFEFFKIQNRYLKASAAMESLSVKEKNPSYLSNRLINIYILTAEETFKRDMFYKSWSFSKKTIEELYKRKKRLKHDVKNMIKAKRILKKSATKLISFYTDRKESDNVNFIYNETDRLIKKVYLTKK